MAEKITNENEQNIIDFNLFDGVEIRGVGPAAEYPVLAKPLVGTAKNERTPEGSSHPPLDQSFFDC